MKANEISYPLAPSGERYKRIAEIINPLLNKGCGQLFADSDRSHDWDLVPLELSMQRTRFILEDYSQTEEQPSRFIGIEILGNVFGTQQSQTVRWFTFTGGTEQPVICEDSMEAMEYRNAILPEALKRTMFGSEENPGYMQWPEWKQLTYVIEDAMEAENISSKDWNASCARVLLSGETTKVPLDFSVILCLHEHTRQHLGFLLFGQNHMIYQFPFIRKDNIYHMFPCIADALANPQDAIFAEESNKVVVDALQTLTKGMS